MKTVKPVRTQIFARPTKKEEQTKSGLFIPQHDWESTLVAEVINVGDEVKGISPKDSIIYREYAITEIKLNEEDMLLVDEKDVLGVVIEVEQ